MKYAQESYDLMIDEIKPLLEAHYHEIAHYQDIPLQPQWETYKAMETMGVLKAFSCRLEETNELVGYAIYFVKKHIHYDSCLVAQQDILFVKKEHRGKGMIFIMWCDARLKEMGVQLTIQHIKAAHNFGHMLERMGYELMDLIYTRRLDK